MVGGGIAGLRAALGLAEIGLSVFLVEKEAKLGGWVAGFGDMYPHGRNGARADRQARGEGALAPGDHRVHQRRAGRQERQLRQLRGHDRHPRRAARDDPGDVGSIVIATGFDTYQPADGELGYGLDGVITIADFKKLLD